MSEEEKVGEVTHYFGKIGVTIVKLEKEIKVGEKLHFKGHTTDFTQVITSIQMNHQPIEKAKGGDEVGIKTDQITRERDEVFKVME